MRKPIKPYSIIYYIQNTRYCIHFSASSEPRYEVEGVSCDDSGFDDPALTNKITKLIKNVHADKLIMLIVKLNHLLGTECMAFNHNA